MTDLHIVPEDGKISTQIDNTFDYERQTSVLVQIKAEDQLETYVGEPRNTAYAQLLIEVLDVNDETPEMRMVSLRKILLLIIIAQVLIWLASCFTETNGKFGGRNVGNHGRKYNCNRSGRNGRFVFPN